MFERWLELITRIVNGFRDNIIPIFDFLSTEFTFQVNPLIGAISPEVTLSVFEMLFGGGLIVLLTTKIILSLLPVA